MTSIHDRAARAFFILAFVLLSTSALAQDSGLGVGIIAGEPTGISVKTWRTDNVALDFALAWSLDSGNPLTLHGDYLSHKFGMFEVGRGRLPLYYGLGATLKFKENDTSFGGRMPVGVNYHFENIALDAFFEFVPVLDLFPETEFRFNAAVGVRLFFKSKGNSTSER